MKTIKWIAAIGFLGCASIVGCAGIDESVEDETTDEDAAESESAQNNEGETGLGACKATGKDGRTISSGTYERDDDGWLYCCDSSGCIQCGSGNYCGSLAKKAPIATPPGGGVFAP